MKKILTILAIMIMATSASFAQQIGIRIGMNFASLSKDLSKEPYEFKSGVGMHLGAVYNLELADVLSLQPGVFYVQRNWKHEDYDKNTFKKYDAKIHSSWLEIPVVLKYNLAITGDIKIDPHVGPYFGFGFAGKNKDTKDKVFSKNGYDFPNFDMGVQFGVGAIFHDVAYAGLDYEIGFRNVADKYDGHLTSHNGMFMITFGVYLPE